MDLKEIGINTRNWVDRRALKILAGKPTGKIPLGNMYQYEELG